MEEQNEASPKKKKELLLGSVNKKKLGLRRTAENLNQSESGLDVTQVTKCVFLGSLCLKPVPHIFDSSLMLHELDKTVKSAQKDTLHLSENEALPILEPQNSGFCKKPPKKIYLKPPKMKKSSLKEPKENQDFEKIVKNETVSESRDTFWGGELVVGTPVPSSTSFDRHDTDEDEEPRNLCLLTNSTILTGAPELNSQEHVEMVIPEVRGPYDFEDDIEYVENYDYRLHRKRTLLQSKISTYARQDVEDSDPLAIDFDEAERLKREPTPELVLSDSDEDAIDQLMFNIMDIKVGPNGFEKKFFEMPTAVMEAEYKKFSENFEQKNVFNLQMQNLTKPKEKKVFRRTPQCKICSKIFQNYVQLKKHRQVHNGEKPYLCLKCNENHTTLDEFIAHLRTHQGKRPYLCKKCNKSFKTMKALENHQPVHVLQKSVPAKKPFKCETCGKEFRKLCDLDRHTRVHTGEKPSVCNICNRRFQQAHNLNKHLLIHTNEKPFECDVCHKKFGRNDVLNRHLLTHAVKKPNHCTICMKSFIRPSQLVAHNEKYHPVPTS